MSNRNYQTEIGRAASGILMMLPQDRLASFVQSELTKRNVTYNGKLLSIKQVSDRIGKFAYHVEKEQGKFSSMVENFVQTLLYCMEKMDPNLGPKLNILKEAIHFQKPYRPKNTPSWITQLLAGEIVNTTGPDGYGPYRLTWAGETDGETDEDGE